VTFLPSAYLAAPRLPRYVSGWGLRLLGPGAPLEVVEWQLYQALGIEAFDADAFWRLSRPAGKA